MKMADHARVGILPDFGNFYTDRNSGELYNPYKGVREFMPWVKKSVSAKAYNWDTGAGKYYTEDPREGREMTLDYERLVAQSIPANQRFASVWAGGTDYRDTMDRPTQLPSACVIDKEGRLVEQYRGRVPVQAWDRIADLI